MKTKFFRSNRAVINLFFIWLIITGFFYPGSTMGQTAAGESQITEIDQLRTKINELKNQIGNLTATQIREVSTLRTSDKIAVFKIKLENCGYIKMSLTKDGNDVSNPETSKHFVKEHIIKFDNLDEGTRYSYEVQLIDKSDAKIIMSEPKTGTFDTYPDSGEDKHYKIVCNDDEDNNFTATAMRTDAPANDQEKYLLEIKIIKSGDQRNTYKYMDGTWFSGNNGQDKIYVAEGSPEPRIIIPWEKFKFSGEFLVHGFLYNEDGTQVYEDTTSLSGITNEKKKVEKPNFKSPVRIEFTPIDTIISWKSDTKANSHIEIRPKGKSPVKIEQDKESTNTTVHTHYLLKSGYYEKFLFQKELSFHIIMESPEDKKMRNEKKIVISFDYPRNEEEKKAFVEETTKELKSGDYKDVNNEIKINIINTLKNINKVQVKKLKKLSQLAQKMLPFLLEVFLPLK